MWNLLFRSAVCPKKGKPQHRTYWRLNLTSQTFNSGPISRSKLYVTLKLLVIYLKMGFEEAPSLFSLWSQHLWGAVEASSRPLSSHPGCRKGSKVRGDLSLAHHHLFFPLLLLCLGQSRSRRRLSPYTGYCYSLPLWAVHQPHILIAMSGDERVGLLPYISSHFICNQKPCLHLTDKLQTHAHKLFFPVGKFKELLRGFPNRNIHQQSRAGSHIYRA